MNRVQPGTQILLPANALCNIIYAQLAFADASSACWPLTETLRSSYQLLLR